MTTLSDMMSLRGRTDRGGYWLSAVFQVGGIVLLAVVTQVLGGAGPSPAPVLLLLWGVGGLVIAWIGFAATIRRWHDRDKSGWWTLIGAVPVIGSIWLLVELGLLAGTPGDNRFGPPPGSVSGGRAGSDASGSSGEDLEAIVARWASTGAPQPVPVAAPRPSARFADRPPVIERLGRDGGFGRRGSR